MRALIEGIGALFGMPVSDGKSRRFRITVRIAIVAGLVVMAWLAFPVR